VSCNAQLRKAIDDYELRVDDQSGAIDDIVRFYSALPIANREITSKLFEGQREQYIDGFITTRNSCNMDPNSYSMPVFHFVPALGRRFGLSLLELHAVQMAAQLVPHTYAFFSISCEILLQTEPSKLPRRYRRGYGFGHLVAGLTLDLFNESCSAMKSNGKKQTFRRFSNYAKPKLPSLE
jgi:hypothetical protein